MAVDLFCYASKTSEKVAQALAALAAEHPNLFPKKFSISKVVPTDSVKKEIALEHGLAAQSMFLVSLNDKESANQVIDVAGIVKQALGEANVVILHTNETLI